MSTKQLGATKGVAINREVKMPREVMNMLKMMGVPIPDNVKEIETETISSDEVKQIIIPRSMSKLEAAKELENQYKNEEQMVDTVGDFEGWNWKDVLVATKRVSEATFGWIKGLTVYTWSGPVKPTEIDVVVDIKNGKPVIEKAFYNNFNVTAWEDGIVTVSVRHGQASLKVNAKKKFSKEITEYFNLIRQQLETNSIYRSRNIVVTKDENANVVFEIIENKGSDRIVLNSNTKLVIDNFVLGSLEDEGKRTFLFTGNYGNGKTEVAMQVGRVAVEQHAQSFFYVKDATVFEALLVQSKKYQPCIIFLEDIDEIASGEERDQRMNSILNTLDGVQTKGNRLTTIFTTNHPDRINSALRRPGRIDLMIQFDNPEDPAKIEIMKAYFGKLIGSDKLDYEGIVGFLPKAQGAVIAEICKRSVKLAQKKDNNINEDVVLACVESMRFQLEMMNGKAEVGNDYETFFSLLWKFQSAGFKGSLETSKQAKDIRKIKDALGA